MNAETYRLLLLEDNAADAVIAQEYLSEARRHTFDITHCATLEDALDHARSNPMHVALLDLFVPDSQGLETLRAFRREFPQAAVLILTGLDDEDVAVEAVQLGAQDYVVKSDLNPDLLSRSLRHAIARKALERRLRASEESYRELFANSLDGVARTAPDGSIIEVNEAFASMLGYTLDELRGKPLRREDVVDVHDPRLAAALQERRRTGRFRGELNFVRRDGTVFPVELTTNIYVDEHGQERTSMIVRDVSEQRANERRLQDQQEQLRRSEQVSLVMIANVALDGTWLMAPPRLCRLLGYDEDELLGMRHAEITHPDDLAKSVELHRRLVAGDDASLEAEKRYVRKDGRAVWVYVNTSIVTDSEGRPSHFRKYIRDVTAERAAEEQAIRNYELLLKRITTLAETVSLATEPAEVFFALFDFARISTPADAITVAEFDPERRTRSCVFAADALNGQVRRVDASTIAPWPMNATPQSRAIRDRQIVVSNDLTTVVEGVPVGAHRRFPPDRMPRASVAIPMIVDHVVDGVFELHTTRNEPFTEQHATALQMAADLAAIATKNLRLLAMERDARNEAEAERERLASVLHHAPALMATCDGRAHVVRQANPAFLSFFHAQDTVGLPLVDAIPELGEQGLIDLMTAVYESGESHVDREIAIVLDRHGTGERERHYFNMVIQALHDANGTISGVLVNAVPITDQVKARQEAEGMAAEIEAAYEQTIEGWARALDLRDEETAGHSQRVTDMTVALAKRFGMTEEELVHIRRGALLHDIGKMGVPDEILEKPGPLTPREWELMKGHTVFGRDLLRPIAFLQPAIDIPYCHHEKWDGSGYPRGLRGEDIPLAARIFAVVDVYDALTSDRPYRNAWPRERVLAHIREQAGKHFDPRVVDAFLDMTTQSMTGSGHRRIGSATPRTYEASGQRGESPSS